MRENIYSVLILFSLPVLAMENAAITSGSARYRLYQELLKQPLNPQKDGLHAQKAELIKRATLDTADSQKGAHATLQPALIASRNFTPGTSNSACYTPDNKNLIVGLDYNLIVIDPSNLNNQKLKLPILTTLEIAVSPNNREFATSAYPPSISRWDLETGKLIVELAKQSAYDLHYDNESKRMLISVVGTGECEIWDLISNRKIQTLPAEFGVTSAQWNPASNNEVASCSGAFVSLFDVRQNKLLHLTDAEVPLYELQYTNNGGTIVAGGQKQFVTFDGWNARLRHYRNLHGEITKDNKPLPVSGNSVDVLRLKMKLNTGADFVIASLNNQTNAIVGFDLNNEGNRFYLDNAGSTAIVALDVSPDVSTMVSGGFQDTEIKIWNIDPGVNPAAPKKDRNCNLQ